MRIGLYMRVSTDKQTTANQANDLRSYCQARGWTAVTEYVDEGYSGAKDRRPALDKLMADVRARRIDCVAVAAFDRFARSVPHLVRALDEFRHLDVAFISLREQIDTASPLGRAVFTIIAAISELERSLTIERIKAAHRRARAEGRRIGRRPVDVTAAEARRALAQPRCDPLRWSWGARSGRFATGSLRRAEPPGAAAVRSQAAPRPPYGSRQGIGRDAARDAAALGESQLDTNPVNPAARTANPARSATPAGMALLSVADLS